MGGETALRTTRAAEPPAPSRAEDDLVWRDWDLSRPAGDPLQRGTNRRLIPAGDRDEDGTEGARGSDRDPRLRPLRPNGRERRGPGRDWLRSVRNI